MFGEALFYGSTTAEQIKDGQHLYRFFIYVNIYVNSFSVLKWLTCAFNTGLPYQSVLFKEKDLDTWQMFHQGNFSVNKTSIPFSAIVVDNAIKQDIRAIKVLGGIKGIANNQKVLDKYFLTASKIGNIIEEFCEDFEAHGEVPERFQHYQLTGSKSERIKEGVGKLIQVFVSHKVKFDETDLVFNVITKKLLPEEFAKEFLGIEDEGNKLYKLFIEERIVGSKSIWDTIKKENYQPLQTT